MTALVDTHILLHWFGDEQRLSAGQRHLLARDSADRILVATAKVLGAVLLTSDRRIRDSSLVPTL
jgi:PIN domain nuclease of toxin-antitoxin system